MQVKNGIFFRCFQTVCLDWASDLLKRTLKINRYGVFWRVLSCFIGPIGPILFIN